MDFNSIMLIKKNEILTCKDWGLAPNKDFEGPNKDSVFDWLVAFVY